MQSTSSIIQEENKGKGGNKLLSAPTGDFIEKLSGFCKKLFKKNSKLSPSEDRLDGPGGWLSLLGTRRADMKTEANSLKEKKHVNSQRVLGRDTALTNENATDLREVPDCNGAEVKDGTRELIYEDPARKTSISFGTGSPDLTCPELHSNPVCNRQHRKKNSPSGSTMTVNLDSNLQSYTTAVRTNNRQVVPDKKVKTNDPPTTCSSIPSSENSKPATTWSFQFFVSCEEGLNLYVDLDRNSSDWIKDLEAQVCISQQERDLKPNFIQHLTSKQNDVIKLDASPGDLLEPGSRILHQSSNIGSLLPAAGLPSVDCVSRCGQTVNQVLDAPEKPDRDDIFSFGSCTNSNSKTTSSFKMILLDELGRLSQCPATMECGSSKVEDTCNAAESCICISNGINYDSEKGASLFSAEMQDSMQCNEDYLPEDNDICVDVVSSSSIENIPSMEAVKNAENKL